MPESPTVAIEWYTERPDGRIIEDLQAWRSAVNGLDNPLHGVFYEMALFTGLRKTEFKPF